MREVALGVVAFARTNPRIHLRLEPHFDPAVAAVLRGVRAGVAENVVRRNLLLHLVERFAEVVRVSERGAAGIGREGLQRFLL